MCSFIDVCILRKKSAFTMFNIATLALFLSLLVMSNAFMASSPIARAATRSSLKMAKITEGVEFNTIAREWRMKWSADNDKKSLQSIQATLALFTSSLKKIDGVKSVQRIVCGGCLDYKVIVALPADKWGAWEAAGFAPEAEFIKSVKAIEGVTTIETQTYTLEPVL